MLDHTAPSANLKLAWPRSLQLWGSPAEPVLAALDEAWPGFGTMDLYNFAPRPRAGHSAGGRGLAFLGITLDRNLLSRVTARQGIAICGPI